MKTTRASGGERRAGRRPVRRAAAVSLPVADLAEGISCTGIAPTDSRREVSEPVLATPSTCFIVTSRAVPNGSERELKPCPNR